MDQLRKLQDVAKKLEKMLETSLHQLKLEQKLRKDGEEKIKMLESKLEEMEESLREREEEWQKGIDNKDEKIVNLEASAEYLQLVVVQKDDEITKKLKMITKLRSMIDIYNLPKQEVPEHSVIEFDKVSQFEKRLSELMDKGKTSEKVDGRPSKEKDSPEKFNCVPFNNTDFIEVSPVIKERPKRIRKRPNYEDFEFEYEIKSERVEHIQENSIGKASRIEEKNVDQTNYDDQDESDPDDAHDVSIDSEEMTNDSPQTKVVKLEPKDLQSLLSKDSKQIKHKTHCKVCLEEFPNRKNLLEHEKESGHYYKFPCNHCDKKFRQKIQAVRHEAQVHSAEMPFKCNKCERQFKSEFSWKRHQDNDEVHKRIENFTPFLNCDVCGKQFERRRRWCLDQHMLTHETEKKYPCDICGKYFRSSSYLQTHMKACSGIKEEECAYCGKKFAKRAVLINHERLHTGEKPYQCGICNERFRTHHNYTNHGKTQHKALSARHFNQMQESAGEDSKKNGKEKREVFDTKDYVLEVVTYDA